MKFSLLTVSAVALGTAHAGILDNVWKKQASDNSQQQQVRAWIVCAALFVWFAM
jgi:hypothetical protein